MSEKSATKLRFSVPTNISTIVENPLQIGTILKNKANLPDFKMNVRCFIIMAYDDFAALRQRKNKANSKPICKRRPRNLRFWPENNDST